MTGIPLSEQHLEKTENQQQSYLIQSQPSPLQDYQVTSGDLNIDLEEESLVDRQH